MDFDISVCLLQVVHLEPPGIGLVKGIEIQLNPLVATGGFDDGDRALSDDGAGLAAITVILVGYCVPDKLNPIVFLEFALDGRITVPFSFLRDWADPFWYILFILTLTGYYIFYIRLRGKAERDKTK